MPNLHQLKSFIQSLFKSTKMMGRRLLPDANRPIQASLIQSQPLSASSEVASLLPSSSEPQVQIQVQAQVPISANDSDPISSTPQNSKPEVEKDIALEIATPSIGEPPPQASTFTQSVFMFEGVPYPFRLYIPSTPGSTDSSGPSRMPLMVLLHGCTQNAEDFARGTTMNVLAEQNHCMVLYPEQVAKSNSAKCWNWYEPGHQQSGRGEPGMIAAMTQSVLASDDLLRQADPDRVYIAGLSAGGAMAAMVSSLYPDIFAALGVHSGLAAGSAQNLMSAFGAMRNGAPGVTIQALPTIVFHGTADKTVNPNNGEFITQAALTALAAKGLPLEKSHSTVNGNTDKTTARTDYRAANGRSYVEHWLVDTGAHAWSGGDATGTYTDPVGPSASAAMLAFFLQHHKQPNPD